MPDENASIACILALIDRLSPLDRERLEAALASGSDLGKVLAAREGLVAADRPCPHCGTTGAVRRGLVSGLIRYRCRECHRTFNALTGTPLARLQKKAQWLSLADALAQGLSVRKTAARCGVHPTTAFRWRHRFLKATIGRAKAVKLGGTTEMDVTEVRESHKGSRSLPDGRKPRQRGGSKGPGADQSCHILMAVQRHGDWLATVLIDESASAIRSSLKDHVMRGATLYTEGARTFGKTFRRMGVRHEKLVVRHGRVRGPIHVQTVNHRHAFFHSFLTPFRGVATKYMPHSLDRFRAACHHGLITAADFLSATILGARSVHA